MYIYMCVCVYLVYSLFKSLSEKTLPFDGSNNIRRSRVYKSKSQTLHTEKSSIQKILFAFPPISHDRLWEPVAELHLALLKEPTP